MMAMTVVSHLEPDELTVSLFAVFKGRDLFFHFPIGQLFRHIVPHL